MKKIILLALAIGGVSLLAQPAAAANTQTENGEEASVSELRQMPDPDAIRQRGTKEGAPAHGANYAGTAIAMHVMGSIEVAFMHHPAEAAAVGLATAP